MNSATMISLSRDLLFRINCRITFEAKIVNKIGGPESWGSTDTVPFLPYTPCIVLFQRRLKYNSGGKWLLYMEGLYVEEGAPVPTKNKKVRLRRSVLCPAAKHLYVPNGHISCSAKGCSTFTLVSCSLQHSSTKM